MGKNKKPDAFGFVFSTNPDFQYNNNEEQDETLPASEQRLNVVIDRKLRRGKEVTLINGFIGHDDDLKDLGKLLKTKCGVGGSVKDGEIIIQGNQLKKVKEILMKEGYGVK